MGFAFFDISILLFTTIATVIIFFVFFLLSRPSHFISDYDSAFSVIDVVKALKTICPVSSANKWRLLPLNFGTHRCWTQKFAYSILKCNIHLFGSAAIVNCSSVHALREIANPSKWSEWDPSVSCQLLVKFFREKQLRRDYYMRANQVIGIQRGTSIESYVSSYRFMNFTENEVGWVLYWDAKKLQFMFFLMQPLIHESDEVKSCLITHIFGTTDDRNSALAVQRLRNIEDFLYLSQVDIMPFDLFPSALSPNVPSNVEGKTQSGDFLRSLQTKEKELPNTLFLLVPFSLSVHCTFRKLKGFKLAVKSYHRKANIEKGLLPMPSHKRALEKRLRRTVSDFCIKSAKWIDVNRNTEILDSDVKQKPPTVKDVSKVLEKVKSNEIFSHPSHTCEGSTNVLSKVTSVYDKKENGDIEMDKPKEKLRSFSETVISNSDEFRILSFSNASTQDTLNESCEIFNEDNLIAVDKQDQNEMFCSSISDFEIVDCYDELSDSRIANFLTQGNYGAAELQAEILLASQLEQGLLNGEDFNLAGGWAIHSYYKGMPVLIKNTTNHFMNTASFLCQTVVPVPPKDVWKCVKNPRFRFISDETVKSVEIIEKISNAQKLIHIYHENPGFLKKELIDFCLLHTEREESKRCYSAFHSIEYEKCPFMNSVTRGILQPSGWVVEEVDGSLNKSKVSYLIQIVISSPDSSYIHNLSSLVPQSVYNLKNYAASRPI